MKGYALSDGIRNIQRELEMQSIGKQVDSIDENSR